MGIIRLFEYLGTFMFAFSGAAVACEEKLDYFGVLFLAAVTAMGGGIIRDAVLNNGTPYAFKEYMPYLFIFIAVVLVIKFRNKIHDHMLLTAFDAVGLAAFTVSSGINAINNNGSLLAVISCRRRRNIKRYNCKPKTLCITQGNLCSRINIRLCIYVRTAKHPM